MDRQGLVHRILDQRSAIWRFAFSVIAVSLVIAAAASNIFEVERGEVKTSSAPGKGYPHADAVSVLIWQKQARCLIVDTRSAIQFQRAHIVGSVHIDEILREGPTRTAIEEQRDRLIVVVCDNGLCVAPLVAVRQALGPNATILTLDGGFERWVTAGLPLGKGPL